MTDIGAQDYNNIGERRQMSEALGVNNIEAATDAKLVYNDDKRWERIARVTLASRNHQFGNYDGALFPRAHNAPRRLLAG